MRRNTHFGPKCAISTQINIQSSPQHFIQATTDYILVNYMHIHTITALCDQYSLEIWAYSKYVSVSLINMYNMSS